MRDKSAAPCKQFVVQLPAHGSICERTGILRRRARRLGPDHSGRVACGSALGENKLGIGAPPEGNAILRDIVQGIAIAVALALLGISVGVMSMTPPAYDVARGATIGFAVAITVASLLFIGTTPHPTSFKLVIGFLAAILVFGACPGALLWINAKELGSPSNSGILIPKESRKLLDGGIVTPGIRIEVGDSGVIFSKAWGLDDMLKIWGEDQFTIEMIDGQLKVSTAVRDEASNILAELQHNEWKVASPPAWDRNYTADALEVKDAKGRIVLQVKVFKDVVQLQGVWLAPPGLANIPQRLPMILRKTPANELPPNKPNDGNIRIMMANGPAYDAQIVFHVPGRPWPEIKPFFKYPSANHLGELL
jgi:hypothetical protein